MSVRCPRLPSGFDPAALPRYPAERGIVFVRWLHFAADMAGLVLAYGAAYLLRFGFNVDPFRHFIGKPLPAHALQAAQYPIHYAAWAPAYLLGFGAFLLVCYLTFGLYDGQNRLRRTPVLWPVLVANVLLIALLAMVFFFLKDAWQMRGFLPLAVLLNIPFTWIARRTANAWIDRMRRRGRLVYRSLLLGTGKYGDMLMERSEQGRLKGYRIVARAPAPRTAADAAERIPALIGPEIAAVFVADPGMREEVLQAALAAVIRSNRTAIVLAPAFLRLHNPFTYGDTLRGIPLVHYPAPGAGFAPSPLRTFASRALAGAMLVLGSPFLLLIGLAIRLETPGPALFVQERYGLGARKFRMYKFRTMVADAEARLAELRSRNETDGALFKMHDDPRVTRVGRFLRRTSLDELPQLINIAKGEMRFVGPRPLPCADVEPYLASWQGFRHAVPPGLTCIWQVTGRSDVGFEAMSQLDIWYALNRSWVLDVRILSRTFRTVVFGAGAY